MASQAHSPWRVVKRADNGLTRLAITSDTASSGYWELQGVETITEQRVADAHRMAAAPELLAALENLVDLCEHVFVKPDEDCDLIAARAALRKAQGPSHAE